MSVVATRSTSVLRVTASRMTDAEADRDRCEYVGGQYQEKEMGTESEWIAGMLLVLLSNYCRANRLGWVFGSNTSFQCFEEVFPDDPDRFRKPDVAFVSRTRLPRLPKGHCEIAPDLAVEVISPNDSFAEVDEKVEEYFMVGVPLVWVVVPNTRIVHIRRLNGSSETLRGDSKLSGEDVVPGFECSLSDIFPPNDDVGDS